MIGLVFAAILLNGFALAAGSLAYTAWSIRIRNEAWYILTRRENNRWRADHAKEIAEPVVRWLRPPLFVAANLLVLYLVWATYHKPQ